MSSCTTRAALLVGMLAALGVAAEVRGAPAVPGAAIGRGGPAVPGAAAQRGAPAANRSALDPFFHRLAVSGRAEVRLEREALDAPQGEPPTRGRAVLEPPDRARLEFDRGERVTLRSDGGEWLQPGLRQCVRLGAARARIALEWWDLLLGRERGTFFERRLDQGRVLIVRAAPGAAGDSAWVTLDARGDPARLEVHPLDGGREIFRLARWRFSAPRGRADFVIAAPQGYESVDLP